MEYKISIMLQTRQTDIYGCGGTHKHTACCDFSKENKMRSPALEIRPNTASRN